MYHPHLMTVEHGLQDLLDAMTACKQQGEQVSLNSISPQHPCRGGYITMISHTQTARNDLTRCTTAAHTHTHKSVRVNMSVNYTGWRLVGHFPKQSKTYFTQITEFPVVLVKLSFQLHLLQRSAVLWFHDFSLPIRVNHLITNRFCSNILVLL